MRAERRRIPYSSMSDIVRSPVGVAAHTVAEVAHTAVPRSHIVLGVAPVARIGLELSRPHIRVTCCTRNPPATAVVQREGVFEDDIFPRTRHVAGGAFSTVLTKVNLRIGVTAHACGGCALVDIVGVASDAGRLGVGTGEREGGLSMVECRNLFPVGCRMTGGALGAELTEVYLRISVAGHTRGGRAFIDVVAMTVSAGRLDMSAGKRERRLVMVERNLIPAACRMAGHAVRAEGTLVFVILLVAGHAGAGGSRKIGRDTGGAVAELAAHIDVLALQFKAHISVVKATVAIHTIVASQAVVAKVSAVRRHKGGLIIHMAADTTARFEGVDVRRT